MSKISKKNSWLKYDQNGKQEIFNFCEGYKNYLSIGKTERECIHEAIRLAEKNGYRNLDEIIKNDYILLVQTYVQEEKVKEQINPVELEMQARKNLIEKLKKELNFSKMVAKFENLNFQELLDDIEELIKSYR